MWLSHRLAYTRPSSGEENDSAGTGGVSPNRLSSSSRSRMTPSSARALRRLSYRRPRSWGCRDAAGFSSRRSRVFFSLAAMRLEGPLHLQFQGLRRQPRRLRRPGGVDLPLHGVFQGAQHPADLLGIGDAGLIVPQVILPGDLGHAGTRRRFRCRTAAAQRPPAPGI